MKLIYVAGPLFNSLDREYAEKIAKALEAVGYKTFVPHRDAGLLTDFKEEKRAGIFAHDMKYLTTCDGLVANLNGSDHDSGTCAEIGYLMHKGLPIVGILDDIRWLNNFIWGCCYQGKHLVRTIEEAVSIVQKFVPLVEGWIVTDDPDRRIQSSSGDVPRGLTCVGCEPWKRDLPDCA